MICYIRIFIFARNSRNRVIGGGGENKQKKKDDIQKSLKLAKGLFASFILFTACWLPYGLITIFDHADTLSRPFHSVPIAIAHFNSTLNPIFFAMSNAKFKKGYVNFIQICCKKIGFNIEFKQKKPKNAG